VNLLVIERLTDPDFMATDWTLSIGFDENFASTGWQRRWQACSISAFWRGSGGAQNQREQGHQALAAAMPFF